MAVLLEALRKICEAQKHNQPRTCILYAHKSCVSFMVACLDTVKRYLWGLGRRLDDFRRGAYT